MSRTDPSAPKPKRKAQQTPGRPKDTRQLFVSIPASLFEAIDSTLEELRASDVREQQITKAQFVIRLLADGLDKLRAVKKGPNTPR